MTFSKYIKLLVVAAVGWLFIFNPNLAGAQSISLTPSAKTVEINGEFTLSVRVEDVTTLFGISLELQYDGALLEVKDVTLGDLLGQDVIFFDMPGDGSISVAISRKAGADGVTGSGVIASITFKAKAEGQTRVSFREETLTLNQPDGTPIIGFESLTITPAHITVGSVGGPQPIISIVPSAANVAVGDEFPLSITVTDVAALFGASFELRFNGDILEVADVIAGDFLGEDVVFFKMAGGDSFSIAISRKAGAGGVSGAGELAAITFKGKAKGSANITFRKDTLSLNRSDGTPIEGFEHLAFQEAKITVDEVTEFPRWDVNEDGVVDISDLVLVGIHFGEDYRTIKASASLSNIGVFSGKTASVRIDVQNKVAVQGMRLLRVDINTELAENLYGLQFDLLFDPNVLEVVGVKPGDALAKDGASTHWSVSNIDNQAGRILDATHVRKATKEGVNISGTLATVIFELKDINISEATLLSLNNVKLADADAGLISAVTKSALLNWEELLVPEKSMLLQNYPNPFNPDTWIPYKLAKSAEVTIRIYNVKGQLIRTLDLGYRDSGYYLGRAQAAHWDGRSNRGEQMSSGLYFYQMQTGSFVATKKTILVK